MRAIFYLTVFDSCLMNRSFGWFDFPRDCVRLFPVNIDGFAILDENVLSWVKINYC